MIGSQSVALVAVVLGGLTMVRYYGVVTPSSNGTQQALLMAPSIMSCTFVTPQELPQNMQPTMMQGGTALMLLTRRGLTEQTTSLLPQWCPRASFNLDSAMKKSSPKPYMRQASWHRRQPCQGREARRQSMAKRGASTIA